MMKEDRVAIQTKGDDAIRKQRKGKTFICKTDSLFERARKKKFATDLPALNRSSRRRELALVMRKEQKITARKGK